MSSDKSRMAELSSTVETQRDQLRRYESKLRDLVHAYKSLQKEKEALESSVQALSQDQAVEEAVARSDAESTCSNEPSVPSIVPVVDSSRTDSDDAASDVNRAFSPRPSASPSPSPGHGGADHPKFQVATLSAAVAAITLEKNRMEQNFQLDRKKLLDENEELAARVTELEKRGGEAQTSKALMQDLRAKMRSQQLEREQEQNDHVVMLSELQMLLTQQRSNKEALELALEEEKAERKRVQAALQAREAMMAFASRPSTLPKRDEEKAPESEVVIETHPSFVKMKKELQDTKAQYHRALQQERSRTKDAEERLSRMSTSSEEVVRSLEDRISELSTTIGTYERLRLQDQSSIETLKEELEKRLTLQGPSSTSGFGRPPDKRLSPVGADTDDEATPIDNVGFLLNEDLSSDPRYLLSKMKDLKMKIDVVTTSPGFDGQPLDPQVIIESFFDKLEIAEIHEPCRLEISDLTSDLGLLKEQLQIVTAQSKQDSPIKISLDENKKLKMRIAELEKEALLGREQLHQRETRTRLELETMKETLFRIQRDHEEEKKSVEEAWKAKLEDVVMEMSKQRDRTLQLLKEKDTEVEMARTEAAAESSFPTRNMSRASSFRSRHNSVLSEESYRPSSVEIAPNPVLPDSGRELESALDPEGSVFYSGSQSLHVACREALSRIEADLRHAWRQKIDLESNVRKLQNSLALAEENHSMEVARLSAEIERKARNQARAADLVGEKNLEYLKNVVYRLIMSRDSTSKLQLIPVVATILQFTAEEKNRAMSKYQSWWGTSAKK